MQSQANREQSADNLGFAESQQNRRLAYSLAPENDPVARHIKMQEDYQTQRQVQAQQANAQARDAAIRAMTGGQDPNQPSDSLPPTWTTQDANDLAQAQQIGRQATKDWENGKLGDPDARAAIMGPAMQKAQALQAKQQAATQYAQQQQEQQQARAQEILVGQQDRLALETRKVFKQHGQDGIVDRFDPQTGQYLGSLQWNPKTQTMEHIKGTEPKTQKAAPAEKEAKEVPASTIARESVAEAKMGMSLTGDKAEDDVAIHEKAREIYNQRIAEQSQAREAKATEKRMKEAEPEALKALKSFTAQMPRDQSGNLDFQQASPQQLSTIRAAMANPKRIGVTDQVARQTIAAVQREEYRRLNPLPPGATEHQKPYLEGGRGTRDVNTKGGDYGAGNPSSPVYMK